jgi:hypothetical protein
MFFDSLPTGATATSLYVTGAGNPVENFANKPTVLDSVGL